MQVGSRWGNFEQNRVQFERLLNLLRKALFHSYKSALIEQNLGSKPAAKQ